MIFPFIDYLAKYSEGYIHPGEQRATAALIARLSLAPGDRVLEYGFGCGRTLMHIHDLCRVQLSGVEVSPTMLHLARRRTRGCDNISLHLVGPMQKLPFAGDCFDKAYAESVLAILDTPQLHFTLAEIHRVLKPGGLLITNDALWKPDTGRALRLNINGAVLRDFGLVQSNADLAGVEDWTTLFTTHGLELVAATPLAQITRHTVPSPPELTTPRQPGGWYRTLRKHLLPAHYRYQRRLRGYGYVRQYLEACLFTLRKSAPA